MSLTPFNRIFINATPVIIGLHWTFVCVSYPYLPAYISCLDNESLAPSEWIAKNQVWGPPIIITFIGLVLLWLSYRPHFFQFPIIANRANPVLHLKMIATVIRGCAFLLSIVFATWSIHQLVSGLGCDPTQLYPVWAVVIVGIVVLMRRFYIHYTRQVFPKH